VRGNVATAVDLAVNLIGRRFARRERERKRERERENIHGGREEREGGEIERKKKEKKKNDFNGEQGIAVRLRRAAVAVTLTVLLSLRYRHMVALACTSAALRLFSAMLGSFLEHLTRRSRQRVRSLAARRVSEGRAPHRRLRQ